MSSGTNINASVNRAARQEIMRVCAEATEAELEAAYAALGDVPAAEDIRAPQAGLVMLRGRIGGNGPVFNVGEATVTRAAVRLSTGGMGFSYLLGGSHRRARLAAVFDAMGQQDGYRRQLQDVLVKPVLDRCTAERDAIRAETAATRVDFFTLVRGED